jgi:sugar O-acyltransferase (sialic acid O-acetyltransferase NeuD family)
MDLVDAINVHTPTWDVLGVLDDAKEPGISIQGLKVLGPLSHATRLEGCRFINAIGSDRTFRLRPRLLAGLGVIPRQFATLVHPLASVSNRARLGVGVCVHYGVSVAGGVSVGHHVWLAPASVIGHDAQIGDFSIVAPAAVVSGFVQIGKASYVGAGSVIRQRVRIGDGALVGMGAVVVRDVEEETTVVGNPSRVLFRATASC